VLDWKRYFALLAKANFAGPLIAHGFAEAEAAASLAFLRERMPRATGARASRKFR